MISDRLFDFNQLTRLLNILSYRTTGDMRKSQQLRDCMSTSIHQVTARVIVSFDWCRLLFRCKGFWTQENGWAGWSR